MVLSQIHCVLQSAKTCENPRHLRSVFIKLRPQKINLGFNLNADDADLRERRFNKSCLFL